MDNLPSCGAGEASLVDPRWLSERANSPDLRVVDVRWYLDPARQGREAYRAGHIPGAVFMDLDRDLSSPRSGSDPSRGRHPWPSEEQVSRVLGALGIGPGIEVVAYDDMSGAVASRLWYLLRAHGHDAVAVLDGGIARWQAEGRPVETAAPPLAPCVFTGRLRPGFVIDKDETWTRGPRSASAATSSRSISGPATSPAPGTRPSRTTCRRTRSRSSCRRPSCASTTWRTGPSGKSPSCIAAPGSPPVTIFSPCTSRACAAACIPAPGASGAAIPSCPSSWVTPRRNRTRSDIRDRSARSGRARSPASD